MTRRMRDRSTWRLPRPRGSPRTPPPSVFLEPESPPPDLGREAGEHQHDLAMPASVPGFPDLSPRDVDDDTFFAQLRGALDDDAPLGPREDAQGVLRWRDEAATAVGEAPSLYDQGQPEGRKVGK